MPRLRNVQSGAVVSTSEATAARLGSEWQPVTEPEKAKEAPEAPRRTAQRKTKN